MPPANEEVDGNAIFGNSATEADAAIGRDVVEDNIPAPAPGAENIDETDTRHAAPETDPADAPENIAPSETPPGEQPAAEAAPAPAAPAQDAPPPWVQQLVQGFQQQLAPVMEYNKTLADIVAQERQTRQSYVQQQAQQRQQAMERQLLEASRPKMPDPLTATPEDVMKYNASLADWQMKVYQQQAQRAYDERFAKMEQAYKEMAQRENERIQQEQLAREEQKIISEVDGIKQKPEFAFLKNKEAEDGFYRYWYALNEQGKHVSAEDAARSLISLARHATQQATVAQAKNAQVQVDAARRAEQKTLGIPPPVRGTASTAGAQQQNDTEGAMNWWNDPGVTGQA